MTNTYLTYEEYSSLGGKLSQASFSFVEYKAELKVDEYTFNRFRSIEEYPDELKACVFDLINIIQEDNSNIQSESLGNHSVTYKTSAERGQAVLDTLKMYLSNVRVSNVPVLYCGF